MTGRSVAVIGSGPAGMAAAAQLNLAGHRVVVFERDEAPGGLLRFGIPDFKLEKRFVDRRVAVLEAEGIEFRCGVDVGVDVTPTSCRPRSTPSCWPSGPACTASSTCPAASSRASTWPWTTSTTATG